MRPLLLIAAALPALAAAPALAQDAHQHHGAGGMDHAGHDMAGMDKPAEAAAPAPADTPGKAPPPPVPADHAADRIFPPERMAAARAALAKEGKWTGSAVMLDRLEARTGGGHDGYAWKARAWYGTEIDRLVVASEGEGKFGEAAERIEVQVLWRHAISPYFDIETGLRQDFRPQPRRTYAVLGLEGHAPYWIETEAQLFVSHKGDVHARLAASHDLRLSGPLVLQPEVEANIAFQDVPELDIGSGLERIEAGARLRYEIRPELAPYIGVSWERSFGGTARAARAAGVSASAVTAVAGLRAFF